MNVFLTGINGFVGQQLSKELSLRGDRVFGVIRPCSSHTIEDISSVQLRPVANIDGKTNWTNILQGIDTVVHLAARVHIMADSESDPLVAYRQTNVEGTIHLAREAAAQGVRRFVYVSSIKVNGEERSKAYTEKDLPAPKDPYGQSKWEAEQALAKVARETGLEVVIIRPPLVYGPGVKANFLRLLGLVKRGIPLPFGSLHSLRSMIFVGNLVSALLACSDHPNATGQTFLVSDNEDLSVRELLQKIAKTLQVNLILLPIPPFFLHMAACCLGKSAKSRRLTQPLRINCQKIRTTLSWSPPYTLEEGLTKTIEWVSQASLH